MSYTNNLSHSLPGSYVHTWPQVEGAPSHLFTTKQGERVTDPLAIVASIPKHLIDTLDTASLQDLESAEKWYKRVHVATVSREHLTGMVAVPSPKPYFEDVKTPAGEPATGHLLLVPLCRKIEEQAKMHSLIEKAVIERKNGHKLSTAKALYPFIEDSSVIPANTPQIAKLLEAAEHYATHEGVPRVCGQNCAPKSASVPKHLHLHILPTAIFSHLGNKSNWGETVHEIKLSTHETVSMQGIKAVGTVVGIDVSHLSPKGREELSQILSRKIEHHTTDDFGVDLLTTHTNSQQTLLYLGFRNGLPGGLYATFGVTDHTEQAAYQEKIDGNISSVPASLIAEGALCQKREPASQQNIALFLTS